MGARIDAALAALVLAAVAGAFVLVGATPSPAWLLAGGVGTVVFELVATRARETVRRYWERPSVQAGSVVLALGVVAVGTRIGSSSVLSFLAGALVTYVVLSAVVIVRRAN